jgi:hypothetical protein
VFSSSVGYVQKIYTRQNKNYTSIEDTWAQRSGHIPKIELIYGSTAVSSAIFDT